MADSPIKAKLIVTDTAPLITLAMGEALDYLLYPEAPIYIPDAVLHEATIKNKAPGAESILAWVQHHSEGRVKLIATQAFADYNTMLDLVPTHRERDLGERAALETIRYVIQLKSDERAVLITEDDWAIKGQYIIAAEDRERVIPITTYDFIAGLESTGRVNSTEDVYRRIEQAGRNASRQTILDEQDESARKAITAMLRKNEPSGS
jgi:hypothetical protein